MSVSEEILVFLFRRERVKHLEIGDVWGVGGWIAHGVVLLS
jgi:hypothetical protein